MCARRGHRVDGGAARQQVAQEDRLDLRAPLFQDVLLRRADGRDRPERARSGSSPARAGERQGELLFYTDEGNEVVYSLKEAHGSREPGACTAPTSPQSTRTSPSVGSGSARDGPSRSCEPIAASTSSSGPRGGRDRGAPRVGGPARGRADVQARGEVPSAGRARWGPGGGCRRRAPPRPTPPDRAINPRRTGRYPRAFPLRGFAALPMGVGDGRGETGERDDTEARSFGGNRRGHDVRRRTAPGLTDWHDAADEVLAHLGRGAVSHARTSPPTSSTRTGVSSRPARGMERPGHRPVRAPQLRSASWDGFGFGRWSEILARGGVSSDPSPSSRSRTHTAPVARHRLASDPRSCVDGEWWGLIGFDDCERAREWRSPSSRRSIRRPRPRGRVQRRRADERAAERSEVRYRGGGVWWGEESGRGYGGGEGVQGGWGGARGLEGGV